MLLVTTRNNVLSLVISSSLSEMTKSKLFFIDIFDRLANVFFRLNKLLGDVVISQGGVVPHIAAELLPSKSNKGKKEGEEA